MGEKTKQSEPHCTHLKLPELTVGGEIVDWGGGGEVDGHVGAADHVQLLLLQHLGEHLVAGGHAGEIQHLAIDNGD